MECVSSDFEMDKGLVKCFEKSFKHKILLKERGMLEFQEFYLHCKSSNEQHRTLFRLHTAVKPL